MYHYEYKTDDSVNSLILQDHDLCSDTSDEDYELGDDGDDTLTSTETSEESLDDELNFLITKKGTL